MRATSAGLSLTVHVALGAAIVWGTLDARPPRPSQPRIVLLPAYVGAAPPGAPTTPVIDEGVLLPPISLPAIALDVVAPVRSFPGERTPPGPILAPGPTAADGTVDASLVEDPPTILAGPLPAYPELLRQARIRGRVVLEVVVDTAGRVEPGSFAVVTAAHPAFVAPAQQALAGTLFRPGRMHGRAVRVRVRIPIDFVLRDRRLLGQ